MGKLTSLLNKFIVFVLRFFINFCLINCFLIVLYPPNSKSFVECVAQEEEHLAFKCESMLIIVFI